MSKYTTVAALEQGDQRLPIWALNGSADSDVGQAGEVHVGIPKINGTKIDALYLPQTFLPQCLTDQIPRPQLLASSEFRNAVNSKLLTLITPEFAAEILREDGVQEEQERLIAHRRTIREATAARSIVGSGADIINTAEMDERLADKPEAKSPTELSPQFLMFAQALTLKSDGEARNMIRGRGRVSRAELDHLIHELHDKPQTVAMLKAKTRAGSRKAGA